MEIELNIGFDTLGDINTDSDNARYAETVKLELENEYPDADVSVELCEHGSCWVSDDDSGEIEENVNLIASKVWDKSDY